MRVLRRFFPVIAILFACCLGALGAMPARAQTSSSRQRFGAPVPDQPVRRPPSPVVGPGGADAAPLERCQAAVMPAGARPVAVLHINGIQTDQAGYDANVTAIRGVACEARLLAARDRVDGLFDETGGDNPRGFVYDAVVTEYELLRIRRLVTEASPAAQPFAWRIAHEISRGPRVVVVAHSRGNLVTEHALARLLVEHPDMRSCVRVVAVAPPDVDGWPAPDRVTGLFAQNGSWEDVLLTLFYPPTGIPAALKRQFPVVRTSGAEAEVKGELALHAFAGTYLRDPATRAVFTRELAAAMENLRATPCAAADRALDGPPDDERPIPAMSDAGRAKLASWLGLWADGATQGRAFAWRLGADGTGTVAAGGTLTMSMPVRVSVVPRGAIDSVYLSDGGYDASPVLRGTVARGTGGMLMLTYVQALIPKTCAPGSPARSRTARWSAPRTETLGRVTAAAFAEIERDHNRRGAYGVAIGGNCGSGL